MAPTQQPAWTAPVRVKHSLFRRDINDGSLVSLVITAIILSILVLGISIYLFKKTWAKLVETRLEQHRSASLSSGPIKGKTSYKLPSLRPQLSRTNTTPVLPTYRESMRERSDSDAMWSTVMNQDLEISSTVSAEDDSTHTYYLPRYSSRKSSSLSFSRQHQHYLSLSLASNTAFKPLDMQPIIEAPEQQQQTRSARPARPAGPRRSLSETQMRQGLPTNFLPLGSHPVYNGSEKTSMHRCSGSFDAAGRNELHRQRSTGKLVEKPDLL